MISLRVEFPLYLTKCSEKHDEWKRTSSKLVASPRAINIQSVENYPTAPENLTLSLRATCLPSLHQKCATTVLRERLSVAVHFTIRIFALTVFTEKKIDDKISRCYRERYSTCNNSDCSSYRIGAIIVARSNERFKITI